jgi:predicted component of type VI protein secretion system
MALNVTLVVVGGDVKTPEVKLRLPSTVGRGRDCSIMLRHPLVSRQHCELFEASGGLMVRDLGSLNGTFVNNQRIDGDAPLQPGQLLTIGTVTFRAMYEMGATDSAPPTTPAPKMKPAKPSNETDTDGALNTRPARGASVDIVQAEDDQDDSVQQTEPIDADMDFDLSDAEPLFSEAPAPKKEPPGTKKAPTGSAETIFAGNKTKPAAPGTVTTPMPPPKPAGTEKAATTEKSPEKAPATKDAAAKPQEDGPPWEARKTTT